MTKSQFSFLNLIYFYFILNLQVFGIISISKKNQISSGTYVGAISGFSLFLRVFN
jgi:hypothetical protein